jgi:hypothetical protein
MGKSKSSKSSARKASKLPARRSKLSYIESLESRVFLSASPWQNQSNPYDVTNTGQVTPLDVLVILNDLNKNGAHSLMSATPSVAASALTQTTTTSTTSNLFEDVNGDGMVTPLDALMVLDHLNSTSTDLMNITLETTDLSGNPITTIQAGQQFQLEAFVQDPNGTAAVTGPPKVAATGGVYAAYPDIAFNSALATVSPSATITYGDEYQNVNAGDLSNAGSGMLAEVGATATGTKPVGPAQFLLFSLPVTATAAGMETFTPSVDANPFYANLLFGDNSAVPADEINFTPASITITANTSTPTISIGNVTQAAPTSGTAPFVFSVTLSAPSSSQVLVNYATADGTAKAGTDYTAESGVLTFAPNVTSEAVTVPVLGTTAFQPSETFTVNLTSPVNATLLNAVGTGTITNSNAAPTLSINNPSVNRPQSGTVNEVFTVTLTGATKDVATVAYATADGSAKAGTDYTAESGTLTFNVGTTAQNITVPVIGSTISSGTETFVVNLSSPTNAQPSTLQGTGSIVSSSTSVASINNVVGSEGTSGTTPFVFTVTLSATSTSQVTVTYATADGTAHAPGDYTATSGTLTFAPGTTTQPVTVNVVGSTAYSPAETFKVNLTGATNSTVSPTAGSGTGTITNSLSAPTLSVNSPSVSKPLSGTANAVFTVTLTGSTKVPATVVYATADGTAHAPGDYTAESGTLTFAVGTTTENVTVPVIGGATVSSPETFTLNLSNPTNAQPTTLQGTGTIISQSAFSINDVTQNPGTSGTSNFVFTVSLGIASSSTQTVAYTTADGTAVAGVDYTAESGTLTFAPGTVTQNVTVPVAGTSVFQPSETFTVNLATGGSTPIVKGIGTGTIVTANPAPTLAVNSPSVTKPTSGSVNEVFTVTLTGATKETATVAYATADSSAKAGTDYTAESGTLTFAAGTTAQNVTVPVLGNSTIANPVTFLLNLTNATNAQPTTLQATGTILSPPAFSVSDVTQNPGTSGTSNFVFAVTLTSPSASQQTVAYATADGTAKAGTDYTAESGTLTFAAGTTSENVTVPVQGTSAFQPSETFTLNLSGASTPLLKAVGTGTITNSNAAPTLAINSQSVDKPVSGTANAVFTVTLTGATKETTTVVYATANGTATSPGDYTAESGTLTFAPGTTAENITVPVVGSSTVSVNKTFLVNLTAPTNATVSTAQGTGTIVSVPAISIANVQEFVGNSPTTPTNFVFNVTLSGTVSSQVTVVYATADGTAVAPTNYTSQSGTLTFAPGVTSQLITVPVFGYTGGAQSENFFVNLSSPVNGTLAVTQATGTAFGNFTPSSLSGKVFTDYNDNGILETNLGEVALQNMVVEISNPSALGDPFSETAVTAADGTYSFTNLSPGTYTISELPNSVNINGTITSVTNPAFMPGQAIAGSQGGTTPTASEIVVTIGATGGVTGTGNNFTESSFAPLFVNERQFLSSNPPASGALNVSTLYNTGATTATTATPSVTTQTSPAVISMRSMTSSGAATASSSAVTASSAAPSVVTAPVQQASVSPALAFAVSVQASQTSSKATATDAAIGSTRDWLSG